jgi:hypothetical protein
MMRPRNNDFNVNLCKTHSIASQWPQHRPENETKGLFRVPKDKSRGSRLSSVPGTLRAMAPPRVLRLVDRKNLFSRSKIELRYCVPWPLHVSCA